MAVVRNLIVRAGADFSSLRSEFARAQQAISSFKGGLSSAVKGLTGIFAGIKLTDFVTSSTQAAIQVEASMQQIDKVMGTSANSFKQWVDTQGAAYNLSTQQALQYGSIYSNLVSTFSTSTQQTADMTENLLKASSVVAAGTGRTIDDVMWRMRSGLLGNTQAINDLGVNVYVSMLKSTDAFKQFANGKSWNQLDFQTKQLITYYGILEQVNKKFGADLNVNTNSALHNFTAELQNLKLALGQAFLPILQLVLPILTKFVSWLAIAMNAFAEFMHELFGYNDPTQNLKSAAGATAGVADGFGNMTDAANAAGDAATTAGDKASKAAKKAKDAFSLAGFDEINNIANTSANSGKTKGTGTNPAGGGLMGLPDVPGNASAMPAVTQAVKDFVAKIKGYLKDLQDFMQQHKAIIIALAAGIAAGIAAAFIMTNWDSILKKIQGFFSGIGKAMLDLLTNPVFWVALAIAAVVASLVYLYETNKQFRDWVNKVWDEIKVVLMDIWNNVLVPFGKWLWNVFLPILVDDIGKGLVWLWNNVLKPLGEWLGGAFVVAWDAVKVAAEWLWKNVLVPLGDFFVKLWNDGIKPLAEALGNALAPVVVLIIGVLGELWRDVLVPLWNLIVQNVIPMFQALGAVLSFLWNYVLVPVMEFIGGTVLVIFELLAATIRGLTPVIQWLAQLIGGALAFAFSGLSGIIQDVGNLLWSLLNFVSDVFRGNWSNIWWDIANIVYNALSALGGALKWPLNEVIWLVNQVIGAIDTINFSMPSWLGGGSFGFNIPYVPYLAQGGYVGANNPRLAVIGDNMNEGEIVAPESKIYNQVLKALQANGGGGGQEIVINLGGTTVFRKLIDGINKANRQAGKNLIHV